MNSSDSAPLTRASHAIAAVLLAGLAAACTSNPVCADDVAERLREDCQLTTGSIAQACLELPDAPAAGSAALADHLRETCEIVDPKADAECLRTESCENILAGTCWNDDAPAKQTGAVLTCLQGCGNARATCEDSCGDTGTWQSCSECDLDCERTYADCAGAC